MRWSPPGWNAMVGTGLACAGRTAIGLTALAYRSVAETEPVTHPGRGHVVLLGGLGETTPCLAPMGRWLTRIGYDVTPYTLGAGMGCAQRTVDSLVRRVERIADETGEPVRIVGHSRGGQFGRAIGTAAPELVGQLITIGTPFDRDGLTAPMAAVAWSLAAAGTAGVPGLLGLGCFVGKCCAGFRDTLRAPWPSEIGFTSIYSHTDGAVPWQSSHDPYAENVVVAGNHVAQLTSAEIQRAVAQALAGRPVAAAATAVA